MSAVSLAKQEWIKGNFDDYVVPKYISAPYTTIQNRAQVLDQSNMLSAVMGVERIPFRGINLLQSEFGPNGEKVYELENKDSRIRAVGGWTQLSTSEGNALYASTSGNDYVEVSFYGTGLNLLINLYSNQRDIRVTIDNGVESANIYPASASGVLGTRNYTPNQILSVASGLSLGQHTIKLRSASVTNLAYITGVEILNQSSLVTVLAGSAFVGNKKETLMTLSTSAFNAGVIGTKGARVSKYLLNGAISQVVTEVPSTPSYLTNTNHSNEEIVKKISFREFGANRADDFSTLGGTASNRAFVLDDGTTNLVGLGCRADQVVVGGYMSASNTAGNFFMITFIGTGLDIVIGTDSTTRSANVSVDGTSIGTITKTGSSFIGETRKVCSGLPYGTHTVKFTTSSAVDSFAVSDFIIYQPKKPTLPVGAIEISDYNIMADFVANTVLGLDTIAQGVLRKHATREWSFSGGTFVVNTLSPTEMLGGFEILQSIAGANAVASYQIPFGTGFEVRQTVNATPGTYQVRLNGIALTAANFPTATFSTYGGGTYSFNSTTGVLTGSNASQLNGAGFRVSGLPLGSYLVTFTTTGGSDQARFSAIDIITPIHINHPSLKVGSLGMLDNSKIGAIKSNINLMPDLSKAKAWCVYDQINQKILASYNISSVLQRATGISDFFFDKSFKGKFGAIGSVGGLANQFRLASAFGFSNDFSLLPNGIELISENSSGTATNAVVMIACFGELENE